jgi:hypothetical protein
MPTKFILECRYSRNGYTDPLKLTGGSYAFPEETPSRPERFGLIVIKRPCANCLKAKMGPREAFVIDDEIDSCEYLPPSS